MLHITDTLGFLIWACVIGVCCAIIHTNIQRSAISRFINALINLGCDSEQNAKTLSELDICGFSARIVKSAVTNQHGLKRIIGISTGKEIEKDEMAVFSTKKETDNLYYLADSDTEEILKKYSYKPMSAKLLTLFIAALLLLAFLASLFTEWMYNYVTIPKIDETQQTEQGKHVDNSDITQDNSGENVEDENLPENENDEETDISDIPVIPSSPSIPTLPIN